MPLRDLPLAESSGPVGGRFSRLRSASVGASTPSLVSKVLPKATRGGGVVELAMAGVNEAVAYPAY